MSLLAATIGAGIAFTVARYLARHWVARKTSGRLKQLLDGVEAMGVATEVGMEAIRFSLGHDRRRCRSDGLGAEWCAGPNCSGGWLMTVQRINIVELNLRIHRHDK